MSETTVTGTKISAPLPTLPLVFEQNLGQTDSDVRFVARGQGFGLHLSPAEVKLTLYRREHIEQTPTAALLRMRLIGTSPNAEMTGVGPLAGKVNYLLGNNPIQRPTNISTFAKVKVSKLYPGVDMIYYSRPDRLRQLEYDFVVAPRADPSVIAFSIDGVDGAEIDEEDLVLQVGGAQIRQHKPVIYQVVHGVRREVAGHYVIRQSGTHANKPTGDASTASRLEAGHRYWIVGFQVADYDESRALIIDPVLSYSSYFGGSGDDYAYGIAIDRNGAVYICGVTSSPQLASTTPGRVGAGGGSDAFVAKLNVTATGSTLVYLTYLGGRATDGANGIAVDASGNAYVVGFTSSSDFPTVNAFRSISAGADAFLTKLNANGSAVLYSTYLGGTASSYAGGVGTDDARAVAVDSFGNAYVSGYTLAIQRPD